ncbi:zinc-dependent alcohol dehydrogenase [Mycolicibacterium sp. Dal123E01]|uniref:zinc-dependent alcohol dehydrogenase n=1 Tax=Mycolicibacterium sp. Dal123E01 TaxID=3457578 RepID=UPI00403E88B5
MLCVRNTIDGIAAVTTDSPTGDGERVRITSAGICGSDLHVLQRGPSAVTIGHEFGGTLEDGTLVAVRPFRSCRQCAACAAGQPHLCAHLMSTFHGVTVDGGLAEEVMVAPDCLVEVPTNVDPASVALVEPIAVAVHAINRACIAPGDRVAIIGGGAIGLLSAAVLRGRDIAVDLLARHPAQIHAAEALGAGLATSGRYDVVIDAAGTSASMEQAIHLTERGGRVLLVALPWDPTILPVSAVLKEVTIVPAVYYGLHDGVDEFHSAADALGRNPWWADTIVTHRFSLGDAAAAFETAVDRAAGAIKVHFTFDRG